MIIKTKYLVFVPVCWHTDPKTLGNSQVESVFCMLMRWVAALGSFGMELVTKDQGMISGLGLSAPPNTSGEGRGLEVEFSHQWPMI